MKTLLCFFSFVFLITISCFAKDSTSYIFHIDKLPPEGVVLDKGWKFTAGDNPAYANPDYDDRNWQAVDPTKDIHDIPALWKNNIVWFRLKPGISDSVRQQPLSLNIDQRGASEIYINGRLTYHFGTISNNPQKIIVITPANKPFYFPTSANGDAAIAIRYTLQPGVLYTTNTIMKNPAFSLTLNYLNRSINLYVQEHRRWIASALFRMGAFFIFFVLHLAFYIYFPLQKANLYFSLFALFAVFFEVCQAPIVNDVQSLFYNRNLVLDFLLLSPFFLLTAIYSLLTQKRKWIYWILMGSVITGVILNAFTYRLGNNLSVFVIGVLINLEISRIAFNAVKQKQRGAVIIATGCVGYLLFWTIFLLGFPLQYNRIPAISYYTYGHLLPMVAFLSVPIATSIYLGLEFAFTNTALKQKLEEVVSLSKEKQQILAAQNEMLEQQVAQRTTELKQSLEELKSTQAQLIQKEKMASLGELTAGIAHEIQNPLNFVNNFSEINTELVDELKNELLSDNKEEALLIADDIKENEQKIIHHGKRADSIVKGMLEHSRASTGKKELTDINALVDECVRLSFHGMRAKDKEFNADIRTEFDRSIGQINVVPQDISRVLLNLLNNAFYAVDEKKRQLNGMYEPVVSVCTKKLEGNLEIHVKDNGNGIPQNIIDKIFQPFFTTKPTGQGTGLGLSLSYDIIKAHGGEIKVESKEGKAGEFTIQLPLKANA